VVNSETILRSYKSDKAASKWYLVEAISYALGCFWVKLSLGLGFLRIFNFRLLTAGFERIVCYVSILVSSSINLALTFALLFMCADRGIMPAHLAAALADSRCMGTNSALKGTSYAAGSINVVVDWTLVLLPLPSILKNTMDTRTRVSILLILLLGAGLVLSMII
jgi:hypothetical protein